VDGGLDEERGGVLNGEVEDVSVGAAAHLVLQDGVGEAAAVAGLAGDGE
jgi:hypothetical protein